MADKNAKTSDLNADIEMYFQQIIELSTLMLNESKCFNIKGIGGKRAAKGAKFALVR